MPPFNLPYQRACLEARFNVSVPHIGVPYVVDSKSPFDIEPIWVPALYQFVSTFNHEPFYRQAKLFVPRTFITETGDFLWEFLASSSVLEAYPELSQSTRYLWVQTQPLTNHIHGRALTEKERDWAFSPSQRTP